jgi:hypothetical protein
MKKNFLMAVIIEISNHNRLQVGNTCLQYCWSLFNKFPEQTRIVNNLLAWCGKNKIKIVLTTSIKVPLTLDLSMRWNEKPESSFCTQKKQKNKKKPHFNSENTEIAIQSTTQQTDQLALTLVFITRMSIGP